MTPMYWSKAVLGDEVDILDGKRVPVNAKERAGRVGPVPYYGAAGQVGWIDEALFDEELILLGEDGAPFFDRTRDVAYRIQGPAWVNNHAHVLRAGRRMINRFLLHQLNQVDYRPFVSGTTRAKLPQGPMREIPLVLPPLPEQHRIVAAIETHFSRLDAAVASLTRAKANVKRARASVLKAAVEGRLVPTEAALACAEGREYEPASVLLERILVERKAAWASSGRKGKYKEPVRPETEGLPGLPEGWCWASVEQLCDVGTGATPKRGNPKYWENGSIPWVTSAVVNGRFVDVASDFVTPAALNETNLTLYEPGTLLVAMYGEGKTRGMAALTRFATTTNQALAALRTTHLPATATSWLVTFMDHNYSAVRRQSSGGVQPNLNLSIVRAIRVPIPPASEQHRIVAEVDRRLSVLDALDATLEANLARCARLRQAILKRAFEGRLVPAEDGGTSQGKRLFLDAGAAR